MSTSSRRTPTRSSINIRTARCAIAFDPKGAVAQAFNLQAMPSTLIVRARGTSASRTWDTPTRPSASSAPNASTARGDRVMSTDRPWPCSRSPWSPPPSPRPVAPPCSHGSVARSPIHAWCSMPMALRSHIHDATGRRRARARWAGSACRAAAVAASSLAPRSGRRSSPACCSSSPLVPTTGQRRPVNHLDINFHAFQDVAASPCSAPTRQFSRTSPTAPRSKCRVRRRCDFRGVGFVRTLSSRRREQRPLRPGVNGSLRKYGDSKVTLGGEFSRELFYTADHRPCLGVARSEQEQHHGRRRLLASP